MDSLIWRNTSSSSDVLNIIFGIVLGRGSPTSDYASDSVDLVPMIIASEQTKDSSNPVKHRLEYTEVIWITSDLTFPFEGVGVSDIERIAVAEPASWLKRSFHRLRMLSTTPAKQIR